MSGKRVLLVFFALLFAAIGFIFWVGATGGGTANRPPGPSNAPSTSPSSAGSSAATGAASADPTAPIAKRIADRKVRDDLRRRILEGWAASGEDDETRQAARAGRFVPRPNADGRGIEPKYIQQVVREDLFPMARKCYEELLVRNADAGGRLEMEFTIAGDDELGGIVEEAGIAKTSSLKDDKMETCMRESLLTLSFPPPAHDGVVTVVYPLIFSPDERDE